MAMLPDLEDKQMFSEIYPKALLTIPNLTWVVELSGELATFALLLCFVGLANLEHRFPKIKRSIDVTKRSYRINISLFVVNSILMSLCSVSTLFVIAEHFSGYGVLNTISNPLLRAVLAFLAFDLLLYAWHQACHRIDLFWIFHRVHHNDPHLNVSTAFRLHVVEILLTNFLKALLIVILGVDKALALIIETVVTLCILFHHANISFRHEKLLSTVMIVPCLHRAHHSTERAEHDHNYGAILSLWDRLFGTLLEVEPKKIGLKGHSPQDVVSLYSYGFGFVTPVGTKPNNLDAMIAEAAFYRAEKRNFYPGYELRDWLEAKRDILNQVNDTSNLQNSSFWQNVNESMQMCWSSLDRSLKQQFK